MPAGFYAIEAEQGATFRRTVTWVDDASTPVILTNCSARMQVRKTKESAAPVLSLTTENGGITIGGPQGKLTLYVSATAMSQIPAGAYYYDLEVQFTNPEADVVRLLEGTFVVSREVTR